MASSQAANIVYDFNDNDAVVDLNEFAGDGVTAGDIDTTEGGINSTAGVDEQRWQRKLGDEGTATMSFEVTIPSSVTLDLTELSFVDGIDSGQGTNDTFSQWDLSITTGSGTPDSGTRSLTTGSSGVTSGSNTVALSGLTGLTDTSVTFTWTVNYGTVDGDPPTGGNNNNRHAFLDDVTLTGTVIPEPSAALLGALGLLALLRRRRR